MLSGRSSVVIGVPPRVLGLLEELTWHMHLRSAVGFDTIFSAILLILHVAKRTPSREEQEIVGSCKLHIFQRSRNNSWGGGINVDTSCKGCLVVRRVKIHVSVLQWMFGAFFYQAALSKTSAGTTNILSSTSGMLDFELKTWFRCHYLTFIFN